MPGSPQEKGHHTRFYIVMATLIVGAIVFLLYFNDSKEFNLTSAIVGVAGNVTEKVVPNDKLNDLNDGKTLQEVFSESVQKNPREVDVALSFDQVPKIKKQARIKDIELKFDDFTTKINVNNDKLELNNLQEVTLSIKSFSGDISLDSKGFSLDGTARIIRANDIALSSAGQIKIRFSDLKYKAVTFDEIELEQLDLPPGDGSLTVGEKFNYALNQDGLKIYLFNGKFVVDRDAEVLLDLEGVAKGITVSGGLLDLNLQ